MFGPYIYLCMQENTLKFVYSGKKEGFFFVCVCVCFFFFLGGLKLQRDGHTDCPYLQMATQTDNSCTQCSYYVYAWLCVSLSRIDFFGTWVVLSEGFCLHLSLIHI